MADPVGSRLCGRQQPNDRHAANGCVRSGSFCLAGGPADTEIVLSDGHASGDVTERIPLHVEPWHRVGDIRK